MTSLIRVQARWTGFTGAPGFSVFHLRDFGTGEGGGGPADAAAALAAYDRINGFFVALKTVLPTVVTIQTDPEVSIIEDTTGELVNSFTVRELVPTVGSAAGSFAAASGSVVNWRTSGIRNGRRIRGRTFLVPLSASVQGADGGITAAARGVILTAAAKLTDNSQSPDMGVYARPTGPGATDGTWSVVGGATVPNKLAVLRSRRD